ncbi:hypothetical protein [Streptomyces litchfieldiae]|uniref:Flagellar hook-length control protein FliK n=1 Tax=Streptomyces litchfieldiae TaxID=3075543 RepID=A0ABU2MI10_9ACTN|nr:hypothetical protein [Streptomyces sp. DSM 44938]MDT0341115.1 hypothetical protein [Streptomyces sp. DSM 44938]
MPRAKGPRTAAIRAAAIAALLGLLHALLPQATAQAARPMAGAPGFCPDASGVTVVVDFGELGGGRVVRCAPGAPADGLAALRGAGFEVAGTNRWGDAFVCRINGRPGADREPCVDTPPASAYWSYWHAENGGEWTYSQRGATYRTPDEGTFEGWSFSLDQGEEQAPPPGVPPVRPASGDDTSGGGSGDGDGSGAGGNGGGGGDDGGSSGGGGAVGGTSGDGSGADGPGGGADLQPGGPPTDGGRPEEPGPGEREPGDEQTPREPGDAETDPAGEGTESPSPTDDEGAGPTPTEAAEWSGEDEEFEQQRAADGDGGGPPLSTLAAVGLAAALAVGGALAAWRRRRAAADGAGADGAG